MPSFKNEKNKNTTVLYKGLEQDIIEGHYYYYLIGSLSYLEIYSETVAFGIYI